MLSKDDMNEYDLGKNSLDLSKSIAGTSSGSVCNITIYFSTFSIATDIDWFYYLTAIICRFCGL